MALVLRKAFQYTYSYSGLGLPALTGGWIWRSAPTSANSKLLTRHFSPHPGFGSKWWLSLHGTSRWSVCLSALCISLGCSLVGAQVHYLWGANVWTGDISRLTFCWKMVIVIVSWISMQAELLKETPVIVTIPNAMLPKNSSPSFWISTHSDVVIAKDNDHQVVYHIEFVLLCRSAWSVETKYWRWSCTASPPPLRLSCLSTV